MEVPGQKQACTAKTATGDCPINHVDPSGLDPISPIPGAVYENGEWVIYVRASRTLPEGAFGPDYIYGFGGYNPTQPSGVTPDYDPNISRVLFTMGLAPGPEGAIFGMAGAAYEGLAGPPRDPFSLPPITPMGGGGWFGGPSQMSVQELEGRIMHSDSTLDGLSGTQEIRSLSDVQLLESVRNPANGDLIQINTRTGTVMDGNTRGAELLRRAADPNSSILPGTQIPFSSYTPGAVEW